MKKKDFYTLFNDKTLALTGKEADDGEKEANYRNYTSISRFLKNEGRLLFYLNNEGKVTWDFTPN